MSHSASSTPPPAVIAWGQDLAVLAARVGLGVILIAHGWQKFDTWTVSGTADAFAGMDVPLPTVAAYFATAVELVGGALLILGFATRIVAALVVVDMAGAWVSVHTGAGFFVSEGGFELVLAIGLGAVLLAAFGAGRISADYWARHLAGR